jgi:hypothetical protein
MKMVVLPNPFVRFGGALRTYKTFYVEWHKKHSMIWIAPTLISWPRALKKKKAQIVT